MQKSIKKNYIYSLCYQLLVLVTPLITTPYVSRVLGADGIGTISYTESNVTYFVLFAIMGITTYGQREVSYVQDSLKKRSVVFWNAKVLGLCTSGVSLMVYLLFTFYQENYRMYLIYALNILAVAADVTWFFQGMEEFGRIVLRNVIFKIINVAYVFLLVRSPNDIYLYAFGHAFLQFLSNASLWGMLPQYIQKVNWQDLHPFKDFGVVLSLYIPTIAIQVYTVVDRTMIGIITQSAFENGYYEQAVKISKMVLTVVTVLGTVMIPRIGYYFERKEIDEVKRLMYRGYRFVWFLGIPLCFGLILVSSNFVPWFFGEGYDKVSTLINILAFLILSIGINNVTGMQYLIPMKRQNMFTLSVIVGAVVNFLLNLLLIPHYQSIGAAIASVVAETMIALVQLYIIRKELSLVQIVKEGIPYYIAGATMAMALYVIKDNFSPSIVNTFALVCCGAAVYLVMLLFLQDPFLISNVKTIYKKVIRR